MNGSRPAKKTGGEDLPPVLGLAFMAFGGMAFWWWQLGGEARTERLSRVARTSGYGPAPKDMVEQIEWLVSSRMADLQGMLLLFGLAALAGMVEGNVRRQARILSGFGLRRFRFGRALLVVWLVLTALTLAAPVPLDFAAVGAVLSVALFGATYNIGRGLRRVR